MSNHFPNTRRDSFAEDEDLYSPPRPIHPKPAENPVTNPPDTGRADDKADTLSTIHAAVEGKDSPKGER